MKPPAPRCSRTGEHHSTLPTTCSPDASARKRSPAEGSGVLRMLHLLSGRRDGDEDRLWSGDWPCDDDERTLIGIPD